MHTFINNMSLLLGYCGLTSIRMFLPTFFYFSILRLQKVHHINDTIQQLCSQTPSWQLSNAFLCVLGFLAIAEIIALRDPDMKQFLTEELDKYAKPILTMLVSLGIVSAQQQADLNSTFDLSAKVTAAALISGQSVWVLVGGGLNYFCCCMRTWVLTAVNAVDPDGELGIQNFFNLAGEFFLLAAFLFIVVFPPIALLLILVETGFAFLFKKIFSAIEKKHSHNCAECHKNGIQTRVPDSAVICPVCKVEQPQIHKIGIFGFSTGAMVPGNERSLHAFHLQAQKRCHFCASPLKAADVCSRCGKEQWTTDNFEFFKNQMQKRALLFVTIAACCFFCPLLSRLFFKPLLIRPYAGYLNFSQNLFSKTLHFLGKIFLLIPMLILSAIPFVGYLGLIPNLIRYFKVKKAFERNIQNILDAKRA